MAIPQSSALSRAVVLRALLLADLTAFVGGLAFPPPAAAQTQADIDPAQFPLVHTSVSAHNSYP